jgi:CHAD domain-containing protein
MEDDTTIHQGEDVGNDKGQAHNEYVREQALILFDRTLPLHELNDSCRQVMKLAALHHNFSAPPEKNKKKPVKVIRKGLQKQLPKKFSDADLDVLAAVIAIHQGKIKPKNFDRLELTPTQQREVMTIVSLLRIATGLDDSNSQSTKIEQIEIERELVWIVVEGPHAAGDAATAQHNARLWSKIGYPKAKILESEDAAEKILPYPPQTETNGITPTDNLPEAGRKALRFHFAQLLSNEEGVRLGKDIEALHNMRVATRRLRAAFDVFGPFYEPGVLKPYLKGLRATGRALGPVRDLDVFLGNLQSFGDALPEEQRQGLDPLTQYWKSQNKKRRKKLIAFLDSQEYHSFKRQFNIFLHTHGAGAQPVPQDEPVPQLVQEVVPIMIYTRLAAVRAYDPYLIHAPLVRLHALRIEFRKLRYAIEFFRESLGETIEEVITQYKSFQDYLGKLNDASVAIQLTESFIESNKNVDDLLSINEYLAAQLEEQNRLQETFSDVWEQFNSTSLRRMLADALAIL